MCERSLILNGRCSPTGRVICGMPFEIILFFNFPISFRNGYMQNFRDLKQITMPGILLSCFNPSCHTACTSVCTEAANSWRRAARPWLDAWQGWWGKGFLPFTLAMGWLRLERSKLLCATSCAASMGSLIFRMKLMKSSRHWHPLSTKVKASNIQHCDLGQSWQKSLTSRAKYESSLTLTIWSGPISQQNFCQRLRQVE